VIFSRKGQRAQIPRANKRGGRGRNFPNTAKKPARSRGWAPPLAVFRLSQIFPARGRGAVSQGAAPGRKKKTPGPQHINTRWGARPVFHHGQGQPVFPRPGFPGVAPFCKNRGGDARVGAFPMGLSGSNVPAPQSGPAGRLPRRSVVGRQFAASGLEGDGEIPSKVPTGAGVGVGTMWEVRGDREGNE